LIAGTNINKKAPEHPDESIIPLYEMTEQTAAQKVFNNCEEKWRYVD